MSDMDEIIELEEIEAPWAKVIKVQEHTYEGGFKMIRLRIHEGRRITDLELDSATAAHLSDSLGAWARATQPDGGKDNATQPDGGNDNANKPDPE